MIKGKPLRSLVPNWQMEFKLTSIYYTHPRCELEFKYTKCILYADVYSKSVIDSYYFNYQQSAGDG